MAWRRLSTRVCELLCRGSCRCRVAPLCLAMYYSSWLAPPCFIIGTIICYGIGSAYESPTGPKDAFLLRNAPYSDYRRTFADEADESHSAECGVKWLMSASEA
jgi:hypothetical protein